MSSSASSASEGGERVIQGSRRPDGTFRKDIRVKAGYVPIEEQATFSSRGSQVGSVSCGRIVQITFQKYWC